MIDFVEPGDVERLPPARPGALARRQDPVRRRLGDGRLGQQDREARPGLRGDLQGADAVKTRPARPGLRPDRGPDRAARPPVVQRADAGPDGPDQQGRGCAGRRDAPPWRTPKTDPVARRHLVWVVDAIAGGTPEATAPLIAALESPSADVRAQAARALGERAAPIGRRLPLIGAAQGPRADGPAPGDHRPGPDRRRPSAVPRLAARAGRPRPSTSPSRPGRRCGGSATGRRSPTGSTRPTPRSAPGSC